MVRTPVLLIGFNRPDNMGEVFAQIKKAQPQKLYIAVDGARDGRVGEAEKAKECQEYAKQVDWPCELHTLFREKNMGCALGVSGAISWAFETEDRLIILEDDCVPVQSFFTFCDEILERYKDDTRVWQVSGRSYHANSKFFKDSDYIFSHYAHIWGWATWKRCWQHFDLMMSDFPEFIATGGALNVYQDPYLGKKANKGYSNTYAKIDHVSSHTWDIQWSYIKLKNGALGIVPVENLIHNIGSASGAHSKGLYVEDIPSADMPKNIRHPKFVIDNSAFDLYHYKYHISKKPSLVKRIITKIKREGFFTAIRHYYSK